MNIAKIVREARGQSRLTTLDFATGILMNLSNYTVTVLFRDDGAVVGVIGWLGEIRKLSQWLVSKKARACKTTSNMEFGQPHPEGYHKALRLMRAS